jgi:hypothetical protein
VRIPGWWWVLVAGAGPDEDLGTVAAVAQLARAG